MDTLWTEERVKKYFDIYLFALHYVKWINDETKEKIKRNEERIIKRFMNENPLNHGYPFVVITSLTEDLYCLINVDIGISETLESMPYEKVHELIVSQKRHHIASNEQAKAIQLACKIVAAFNEKELDFIDSLSLPIKIINKGSFSSILELAD